MKLLELLKKQRDYFIRLADGTKHITNHLLYNSLENELFKEQKKIGLENKKQIKLEYGIKVFPKECGIRVRPI